MSKDTELVFRLTPQEDLEAHYAALVAARYNAHDTAIHLARFAEARLFVETEKVQKKLCPTN